MRVWLVRGVSLVFLFFWGEGKRGVVSGSYPWMLLCILYACDRRGRGKEKGLNSTGTLCFVLLFCFSFFSFCQDLFTLHPTQVWLHFFGCDNFFYKKERE